MNITDRADFACWVLQPLKLLHPHERWRKVAKILKISKEAQLRLEWIICYREGFDASQTARNFGIMSIPALKIFMGGKVVKEFVGVQAKETLKKALEELL